mmetsp:Transcript_29327/g.85086  ORF Transcript_29327/g.85086 Transcript_29327/m.85086 type:complete len:244 (+) Transcript_29327:696-1427(+)
MAAIPPPAAPSGGGTAGSYDIGADAGIGAPPSRSGHDELAEAATEAEATVAESAVVLATLAASPPPSQPPPAMPTACRPLMATAGDRHPGGVNIGCVGRVRVTDAAAAAVAAAMAASTGDGRCGDTKGGGMAGAASKVPPTTVDVAWPRWGMLTCLLRAEHGRLCRFGVEGALGAGGVGEGTPEADEGRLPPGLRPSSARRSLRGSKLFTFAHWAKSCLSSAFVAATSSLTVCASSRTSCFRS